MRSRICALLHRKRMATSLESALSAPLGRAQRNHTHVHRASSRSSTPTAKMPYRSESMIVFAAREAKKMWPFLAGFAVVGFGVTQATLGITEADKKKSAFLNPGGHH